MQLNYKEQFMQDLSCIISNYGLDKKYNCESQAIAQFLVSCCESLSKLEINKEKKDETEFIDRMYALYPAKCPKRGTTTGKSHKDKQRIKKLLKTYTMEEIEKVFQHEIEEKFGKQYLQNFSTFLNNFPDPNALEQVSLFYHERLSESNGDSLVINGQIYR